MESLEQGTAAVRDLVRGTGGRIEIGAAPAVSTYVLPRALQRFASEHPAVSLGVRTGHSEELLALVLAEGSRSRSCARCAIREIESIAALRGRGRARDAPAHPLAGDHAVRVEQLGDQELILFDPSSSYHELTSSMFRAAGVSPRGVMVLDSIDAAKRMVQLGLGIALLPRSALSDELDDGSLAAVTVVSTRRCAGRSSPSAAATRATSPRRWRRSVRVRARCRRLRPVRRACTRRRRSRIAPQISPSVARARTAATIAGIAFTLGCVAVGAQRRQRGFDGSAVARAAHAARRASWPPASAGSTWKKAGSGSSPSR